LWRQLAILPLHEQLAQLLACAQLPIFTPERPDDAEHMLNLVFTHLLPSTSPLGVRALGLVLLIPAAESLDSGARLYTKQMTVLARNLARFCKALLGKPQHALLLSCGLLVLGRVVRVPEVQGDLLALFTAVVVQWNHEATVAVLGRTALAELLQRAVRLPGAGDVVESVLSCIVELLTLNLNRDGDGAWAAVVALCRVLASPVVVRPLMALDGKLHENFAALLHTLLCTAPTPQTCLHYVHVFQSALGLLAALHTSKHINVPGMDRASGLLSVQQAMLMCFDESYGVEVRCEVAAAELARTYASLGVDVCIGVSLHEDQS
jgi:hypothetical protein